MTLIFVILIVLAAVVLGFIVLVQNPKGGGLAGNIAGFSNQFMGVKQTTDILEKGTWIFAAIIGILCLTSAMFISGGSLKTNSASEKVNTTTQGAQRTQPGNNAAPANQATIPPAGGTPQAPK